MILKLFKKIKTLNKKAVHFEINPKVWTKINKTYESEFGIEPGSFSV